VNEQQVGRFLRMLRMRRGWRLTDVAARAKLSPATIARTEHGWIVSLRVVQPHAAALDVRVDFRVVGRGADVARLTDEEHAAIVELLARAFRMAGWEVEVEASYSEYGERGRIDLVAYDPTTRTVVIVEVKTELADLQELFGGLDVNRRLVSAVCRPHGWEVARTVTVLALASVEVNRRLVRQHSTLFSPFARSTFHGGPLPAVVGGPAERVLLWIPASAAGRGRWLAGRRRVRAPERRNSPRRRNPTAEEPSGTDDEP
jgi:transcriptional regulator with XRE-family HTH domain